MNHPLPLVQDKRQVLFLHCCIITHNLNLLPLRNILLLFDPLVSVRPSIGLETSFTVHSYTKSTQFIEDQESASSVSAINTAELPYSSMDKNSRSPESDPDHCPLLILDSQKTNHPSQVTHACCK